MENNDILIAVSLVERALTLMKEDSREPIKKNALLQVNKLLDNSLAKFTPYTKEVLMLTPCVEIVELIKLLTEDATFVETDNQSKTLIIKKLHDCLDSLYLFAGKFYIENEFSFSLGISDLLKRIVSNCVANNYFFGYDTILRAEGEID